MKKIAIFATLASFLICYLEWPPNNSAFVFEMAYMLLAQKTSDASTMLHPMVLAPFVGWLLLVFSLFQKEPNKRLVYAGIAMMAILAVLLFAIGLMGKNVKITLFALPFILSGTWCVLLLRKG